MESPRHESYPCEEDPFSIVGLRELARVDPTGWRARLVRAVPPGRLRETRAWRPTRGADDELDWEGVPTLRDVALAYVPALLPRRDEGVESVRKARQLLSHLRTDDDVRPQDVFRRTDKLMRAFDGKGRRLTGRTLIRATSVYKTAIIRWTQEIGVDDQVFLPMMFGGRPARRTVPLRQVAAWFSRVDRIEALKLGLVLGCGLSGPEVESLDEDSYAYWEDRASGATRVFVKITGDRQRAVPLPQWLVSIWLECWRECGSVSDAPRIESTIRRLKSEGGADALSVTALRTTWQFIVRRQGLPRGAVRGTMGWANDPFDPAAVLDLVFAKLWMLACSWPQLGAGPAEVLWDRRGVVPARAPSRTQAHEPELKGRRRKRIPPEAFRRS